MESRKAKNIIYWIATIWLVLGMASAGIVQIMKTQAEVDLMIHLGYPLYFLTIIGIGKILGVIAILIPKYPVLKEWAYAGFFFTMIGGLSSHLAVGDSSIVALFPGILLLLLITLSWYFRPESRKVSNLSSFSNHNSSKNE